MTRWGVFVLALAMLAGCKLAGAFSCDRDEQCRLNGNFGTCEPVGFCSFGDTTCPSGQRFDSLAGGGFAGQCVGDETPDDGPLVDAPPPDPRCTTWPPPQHFMPCAIPMPNGDLTLTAPASPYVYNTTSGGGSLVDKDGTVIAIFAGPLAQVGGPDVAVLSVENLVVESGATLLVVGAKPLLVAVWNTALVDGTIDAGSHLGVRDGAGNQPDECNPQAPTAGTTALATGGSGGGGGGGFRGRGSDGGTGGAPLGSTPTVIRGGCRGAASGEAGPGAVSPSTAVTISPGARGGGAFELVAFVSITVNGVITAGGAGSQGAAQGSACGGGGAGSGGYIGLEAPTITLGSAAVLASNGGGGGGSGPFAGAGNAGGDATANATPAPGGVAAGACGHAGSVGSAGASLDGGAPIAPDNCGGSGGGGGAGFIIVHSPSFSSQATISPNATETF